MLRKPMDPTRAVLCAALVIGTLDALDAIVVFGLLGASPVRIFQSIARGLLGRASFQGGFRTALLGAGIHYLIAFGIAFVYYLAARRVPTLVRHPVASGMAYGVLVYFFMNLVVIPLSAIGPTPFSVIPFVNGILIHMFGVGLPAALFVRAALGQNDTRPPS